MHRVLVLTGGGDCPGLNAVIRGIVKRAAKEGDWEIVGSYQSFDGVLREPTEVTILTEDLVAGIHVRGGTILGTTNVGGPFAWRVYNKDGTFSTHDRSDEMIRKLQYMDIDAVINIGGDGSQRISQALHEKGLNVIGVPKTIDNDLSMTDFTFGFQTAVQAASEAIDKLVTTAESHNRILILEVMGRYAGWIALHSAIAGGAEVCLIPEIPYDINIVLSHIRKRFHRGKGFAIIVVAEGAQMKGDNRNHLDTDEKGQGNPLLSGAALQLKYQLKTAGCQGEMRETVLGHLQRGGTPIAFDRILATQFGVKAFEMVLEEKYGEMVAYRHPDIISVPIKDAIAKYNYVAQDDPLINTAKGIGICFGDEY